MAKSRAIIKAEEARATVLRQVLLAFAHQRDPIPDSDLDDEQPISLTISTTLGAIRKISALHRAQTELVRPGYEADDSNS